MSAPMPSYSVWLTGPSPGDVTNVGRELERRLMAMGVAARFVRVDMRRGSALRSRTGRGKADTDGGPATPAFLRSLEHKGVLPIVAFAPALARPNGAPPAPADRWVDVFLGPPFENLRVRSDRPGPTARTGGIPAEGSELRGIDSAQPPCRLLDPGGVSVEESARFLAERLSEEGWVAVGSPRPAWASWCGASE